MTLSVEELRRAAHEARKLAMECVEGTAPEFGTQYIAKPECPACAIGTLADRAAVDVCGLWIGSAEMLVSRANGYARRHPDAPSRLVFPFLALADALDEQADAREAEEPSRGRSAP